MLSSPQCAYTGLFFLLSLLLSSLPFLRRRVCVRRVSATLRFRAQSITEFLKDLPCHNEENFSLFNTENGVKTSSKRPSVYIPTVDIPSEQGKWGKRWCCWLAVNNGSRLFRVPHSDSYRQEEYSAPLPTSAMGQKGKL